MLIFGVMDVSDVSQYTDSTAYGKIELWLIVTRIESVIGFVIGTNRCNDLGLWDG